ncbi:ribonuclease HI large subunit [Mytilinidion resinicola]|uniref:Ribonuclease n=1 Tax=Mytilinidion resinicola TaxID=574789 RepID=A0A6A6YRX1_9PEZI|nr:ribonuclease HI large subunit [Mytilinidion resinicola]KAF2810794.1 ribonuclease HI large subunit [Mytilinidion resinicola]
MAETMEDTIMDTADIEQETPPDAVFMAPSIHTSDVLIGRSYAHYSPIPSLISADMSTACVLGVDEAGRGPVLGPMVYGLLYLPLPLHTSLLASTHHFDDSKVLTPQVRSALMRTLCTPATDLHASCGWAAKVMSARDIAAGMLRPAGAYNLNAQAMDATIELIKGVLAQGVNVAEIYIDTIGSPAVYQRKLERIFPMVQITVAKKADSLYPCVSAASVCAKVTRDAALEVCAEAVVGAGGEGGWGSGYPSDARCSGWLKRSMDPVFGWGSETRFSWGTAKELLETKSAPLRVEWPVEGEEDATKMTDFFAGRDEEGEGDELSNWYGRRVTEEVF